MEKLVSIIVPVYNAEDNIKRCLESLINQTYENIEIITVNDGSKDNSLQIIQDIALSDNRIKVFDKSNGGVSSARNLGIKNAGGKYLMFVDADDYISVNAVEECIKAIGDGDAVQFLFNSIQINKSVSLFPNLYNNYSEGKLDIKEVLAPFLTGDVPCNCWSYLYSVEVLRQNDILFDEELNYGEDFLFVLAYLLRIENIKLIAKPLYQYCETESSLTRGVDNMLSNLKKFPLLRNKVLHILGGNDEYINLYNMQISRKLIIYYSNLAKMLNRKEFKKTIYDLNKTLNTMLKEFDLNKFGKGAKLFIYLNLNNQLNLLYLYMRAINH